MASKSKEQKVLERAQEMRRDFHNGREGVDIDDKPDWDDLSAEKQQRWLDEAAEDLA